MGVYGLTRFVETNYKKWRKEELSGKLIVDGYCILFTLYTCDWTQGGQYPEFSSLVQRFFGVLKKSSIDPVVVLDGVDVEGKMTDLVKERRRESITIVDKMWRLQRREFANGSVFLLPPLSLKVFIMTLQQMQVEIVYADGERDVTIYKMANGYCCPVLSNNSDFFMYNLVKGYIPIDRLEWEGPLPIMGEVFYHKRFCADFGIDDCDLRLAIPAISGNYFINQIDDLQLTDYIHTFVPRGGNERSKVYVEDIIYFIKEFSSAQNFKDSITFFPDLSRATKDKLLNNFVCADKMYNSEEVCTSESLRRTTSLLVHCCTAMPDWILEQFRNGNFSPIYALTTGKIILDTFIDDTSKPSCTLASESIRQAIYGLMGWEMVKEIRREELDLVEKDVVATLEVEGYQLPSIQKIPTLSQYEREHLFYSILGCSEDELLISKLDGTWHLVIAATRYWVRECSPLQHDVEVLILCFVALYSQSNPRIPFRNNVDFRTSDTWMIVLHLFSQWQSCYADAVNLNQILMLPLKQVCPSQLYDGRLLMLMVEQRCDERLVSSILYHREDVLLFEKLIDVTLGTGQSNRYSKQPAPSRSNCSSGKSHHSASAMDRKRKSLPLSHHNMGSGSSTSQKYIPPHLRHGSSCGSGTNNQSLRYHHSKSHTESRGRERSESYFSDQHTRNDSRCLGRYKSDKHYEGRIHERKWRDEDGGLNDRRRGNGSDVRDRYTQYPKGGEYHRDEGHQGSRREHCGSTTRRGNEREDRCRHGYICEGEKARAGESRSASCLYEDRGSYRDEGKNKHSHELHPFVGHHDTRRPERSRSYRDDYQSRPSADDLNWRS